jgi:hypothetical protein
VRAGEQDGAGVVSQVWEGVSRMTALAKQTTAAFLEGSVVLAQAPPGALPQDLYPCSHVWPKAAPRPSD